MARVTSVWSGDRLFGRASTASAWCSCLCWSGGWACMRITIARTVSRSPYRIRTCSRGSRNKFWSRSGAEFRRTHGSNRQSSMSHSS